MGQAFPVITVYTHRKLPLWLYPSAAICLPLAAYRPFCKGSFCALTGLFPAIAATLDSDLL